MFGRIGANLLPQIRANFLPGYPRSFGLSDTKSGREIVRRFEPEYQWRMMQLRFLGIREIEPHHDAQREPGDAGANKFFQTWLKPIHNDAVCMLQRLVHEETGEVPMPDACMRWPGKVRRHDAAAMEKGGVYNPVWLGDFFAESGYESTLVHPRDRKYFARGREANWAWVKSWTFGEPYRADGGIDYKRMHSYGWPGPLPGEESDIYENVDEDLIVELETGADSGGVDVNVEEREDEESGVLGGPSFWGKVLKWAPLAGLGIAIVALVRR